MERGWGEATQAAFSFRKNAPNRPQKSPTAPSNEPYIRLQIQELYISLKRALRLPQKSPTSPSKEPYISLQRALHLPQKSPTSPLKEHILAGTSDKAAEIRGPSHEETPTSP